MDPITDMLNQIKSAQAAGKTEVFVNFSKIKSEIAGILSKENFVGEVKKATKESYPVLKISLKCMEGFKRISKPGQRIYHGFSGIKKVRGGYGISIISTSKGLMTDKDARRQKIGGEILLEIW